MNSEHSKIQVCPVALGNMRGIVSLSIPSGYCFSKSDWVELLHRNDLHHKSEMTLKRDGLNSVVVKTLEIGGRSVRAVIKTHASSKFVDKIMDLLRPAASVKNFRVAAMLAGAGIAAEFPMAAMRRRKGLLNTQSIYITQYVPDSKNLHGFLWQGAQGCCFADRKEIAGQVAGIFASLHRAGLWHRDAKATNFLVHRDMQGKVQLMLVDLDGIKHYLCVRRRAEQLRGFVNLAASLLGFKGIHRTDYLRVLAIYCKLTGLGRPECRRLYRNITAAAMAKRMNRDKTLHRSS